MMARIRTIKPEFFSHEQLASKSAYARLLAIGLLTLADCEGRLRWVPMQVHSQVFPWEAPGEAFDSVEVLLRELIECDYVFHYEVDGKRYVEIKNFRKHQRLSGKEAAYASRLPPPPEKTNDSCDRNGEATGKHPGTSQGSGRNPLGTGEQGNIGTGEHRNRESVLGASRGSTQGSNSLSLHMRDKEFSKVWGKWRTHLAAEGKPLNVISEEEQLMRLSSHPVTEAIDIVKFSIHRQAKNLILNGDHKKANGKEKEGVAW